MVRLSRARGVEAASVAALAFGLALLTSSEARAGAPVWAEQAELVASDGAAIDTFGAAVAISATTAAIGAPAKTVGANAAEGTAYVFSITANAWTLNAELEADDGAASDRFGTAIAIDGDTIVVGAPTKSIASVMTGAAFVFVRSAGIWTQQAELTASDGTASDHFGASVAISGDTVIVGAPRHAAGDGAAYVFTRSGTAWSQQQELTSPPAGASFGGSVAVDGDLALVGASAQSDSFLDAGAAFVFARTGSTWSSGVRLDATDAAKNQLFGASVAISGTTALVGSRPTTTTGGAYAFVLDRGAWTQQQKLTSADAVAADAFGGAVSLSGDRAMVGASKHADGARASAGAAYVFDRTGTVWAQTIELLAPDGAANDGLGVSVGLSDTTAIAGASHKAAGTAEGAAYVFGLGPGPGTSCADPSACASLECVTGVCCDAACDDPCSACTTSLGATKNGVCSPAKAGSAGSPACGGGFACNGVDVTCPTSCASDADCAADLYCAPDATCVTRKPQGSTCDAAVDCIDASCRECASGHCADGFCCDAACDGGCDVCAASLGASTDGTCTLSPAGSAGSPVCPPPFACNGVSSVCPSKCATDGDCEDVAHCDLGSGICVPGRSNGKSCGAGPDCASGICAESLCCDAACGDACASCALPDSLGICTPVFGAPPPTKPACPGEAGLCGAACNGIDTTACTFPGSETSCGVACKKGALETSACDGTGNCAVGESSTCPGDLACEPSGSGCLPACGKDADCTKGTCSGGACVDATTQCSPDGESSITPIATTVCLPYACDTGSGLCKTTCSTNADCQDDYACELTVCTLPPADLGNSCNLSLEGRDRPTSLPGALALGLAALALGARRRRR